MDVVQRLLDERRQSYFIVKKNCVRHPIVTGHCEDCHDLKTDVQHYDNVSLNIPPESLPNVYHHIDDEQNIGIDMCQDIGCRVCDLLLLKPCFCL